MYDPLMAKKVGTLQPSPSLVSGVEASWPKSNLHYRLLWAQAKPFVIKGPLSCVMGQWVRAEDETGAVNLYSQEVDKPS